MLLLLPPAYRAPSAYPGFLVYSPKLELGELSFHFEVNDEIERCAGMSERVCDWGDPWSHTEKVFERREGLTSKKRC